MFGRTRTNRKEQLPAGRSGSTSRDTPCPWRAPTTAGSRGRASSQPFVNNKRLGNDSWMSVCADQIVGSARLSSRAYPCKVAASAARKEVPAERDVSRVGGGVQLDARRDTGNSCGGRRVLFLHFRQTLDRHVNGECFTRKNVLLISSRLWLTRFVALMGSQATKGNALSNNTHSLVNLWT